MRRFYFAAAILLATGLMAAAAFAQNTYTWNVSGSASFADPNSWNPSRSTPDTTDILVFNNGVADTATGIASGKIGQILVSGNTTVNLSASGTATLTIIGGTGVDLSIDAGSALNIIGANALTVFAGAGATGSVSGTMMFTGAAHKLNANDASAITFASGAVFTQGPLCTSNVFTGSGTANVIIFASGSTFVSQAGSNPFGLSAPNSKVIFQTGSLFRHEQSGFPSFSGRTYANFELNYTATYNSTGGSPLSIDNLTITKGALTLGMTGTFNLKGNISVAAGDSLVFGPASPATLTLSGASPQTISAVGTLAFLTRQKVNVNGAGIVLQKDLAIDTVTLTSGSITLGSYNFTVKQITGGGVGKSVITNGTGTLVKNLAASNSFVFPVAYDALTFNPVTLTLGASDVTDNFAVNVASGITPSLPNNNNGVQSTWTISEGTPGGTNATLAFQWAASQEGSNFPRDTAGIWKHDGATWTQLGGGLTTGADPYVFTASYPVTSFSPFVIARGVPTASFSKSSMYFGTVNVGFSKVDTVVITNTGAGTLDITSATSTDPDFTVLPASANIPAAGSASFEVTFTPASPGSKSGKINFVSNTASGLDSVTVSGNGAQAGFMVAPSSLAFGTLFKDESKTDTLTVTNVSTTAQLTIDSVISSNPAFVVLPFGPVTLDTSASTKYTVDFTPTAKGHYDGLVVFFHNAATKQDTVRVSGDCILKVPTFIASPTSLVYTNVEAGHSVTDTVKVKNTGYDTLKVASVSSTDPAFTTLPQTAEIAVGDSGWFFVTFTPPDGQTHYAHIIFTDNTEKGKDTVSATGGAYQVISIADARNLGPLSTVTIQGIVTRARGTYSRIQDSTAAMMIYQGTTTQYKRDIDSGVIKEGTLVKLSGVISDYNGLMEIAGGDLAWYQVISQGHPLPEAKELTLKAIMDSGEVYESQLVSVKGLTITGQQSGADSVTFTGNKNYYIKDASDSSGAVTMYVRTSVSSFWAGRVIPSKRFDFVGVYSQYSPSDPLAGYELDPVDSTDLSFITVGVADRHMLPTQYALDNNYPNPFNPTTTIQYALPHTSRVTLKIFSILGQEVRTLVDEIQGANFYKITWDGLNQQGSHVTSGVYFYQIVASSVEKGGAGFTQVKKMIMLK